MRVVACAVLAVSMLSATAHAEVPLKAPVAAGSVPLSEPGRYRANRGFDDLIDYYKRMFKTDSASVRWHTIINQPGLRAKHLASLRKSTEWEGLNIYEHGSEVRLFVVPRTKRPAKLQKGKPAAKGPRVETVQ